MVLNSSAGAPISLDGDGPNRVLIAPVHPREAGQRLHFPAFRPARLPQAAPDRRSGRSHRAAIGTRATASAARALHHPEIARRQTRGAKGYLPSRKALTQHRFFEPTVQVESSGTAAAGFSASVCQPSTLRIVIWPDANKAQNSMAAVSADGSTVWVLILRLNSSCRRSMALVVRADFH